MPTAHNSSANRLFLKASITSPVRQKAYTGAFGSMPNCWSRNSAGRPRRILLALVCVFPPYGDEGLETAIHDPKEAEPRHGAGDGNDKKRRDLRSPFGRPKESEQQHEPQHAGDDGKARVQPWQEAERSTDGDPSTRARFALEQRQRREQDKRATKPVRVDRKCLKEERRPERADRPRKPRRRRAARQRMRLAPQKGAAGRGDKREKRDHARIAGQRERWRHDDRQSWRVNGVHLSLRAAPPRVRAQRPGKILQILPLLVVVCHADVAVVENALRDDEIVRLIAARHPASERPRTDEVRDKRERGSDARS